jgi:hypothetical protein
MEIDVRYIKSDETCDVEPGCWYLCAVCLKCQEPIRLVQVLAAPDDHSKDLDMFKRVPCAKCGARFDYEIRDAIHLRAEGTKRGRGRRGAVNAIASVKAVLSQCQ